VVEFIQLLCVVRLLIILLHACKDAPHFAIVNVVTIPLARSAICSFGHSFMAVFLRSLPPTLLLTLLLALVVRLVHTVAELIHIAISAAGVALNTANFAADPVRSTLDSTTDVGWDVLDVLHAVANASLSVAANVTWDVLDVLGVLTGVLASAVEAFLCRRLSESMLVGGR